MEESSSAPQLDAAHPSDEEQVDDAEVYNMEICTKSTNEADNYAHRGAHLQSMPFYVYRMYVRRVLKRSKGNRGGARFFAFEEHYAMAPRYEQEVLLTRMSIPTIDGFHCPTWAQDPEQNSLFKALLFTPWACKGAHDCGSVCQYRHLLRDCSHPIPRPYTFERAWRLRCAEIHVLARRADLRCRQARKRLVLADTTLFSEVKEPRADLAKGELVLDSLGQFARSQLARRMPAEAARRILAFSDLRCAWHEEQCVLRVPRQRCGGARGSRGGGASQASACSDCTPRGGRGFGE